MICFRDMTFCGHYEGKRNEYTSDCVNTECRRFFSKEDSEAAERWMENAPVAFSDMSGRCEKYIAIKEGEG
jgi:hypothetical protein